MCIRDRCSIVHKILLSQSECVNSYPREIHYQHATTAGSDVVAVVVAAVVAHESIADVRTILYGIVKKYLVQITAT